MHKVIEPAILYFGTPTVILSTLNPDGSSNLAPNSSIWWLGWTCMIGLDASSQTTTNLKRTGQCVINLASVHNIETINTLALTTGKPKVPLHKKALGYKSVADKFSMAGLTPLDSTVVAPKRIKECQIHLEGEVANIHDFGDQDPKLALPVVAFEMTIKKIHADEHLLYADSKVDPNKWNPLIMNFRELYGLSSKVDESRLAASPEILYAPWKMGRVGKAIETVLARMSGAE